MSLLNQQNKKGKKKGDKKKPVGNNKQGSLFLGKTKTNSFATKPPPSTGGSRGS